MLREFRNDYGFSLKDCERLSGIASQRISEFERKEDTRQYFVTKQMSKYIQWVKEYRSKHLTVREMADCLAYENKQKEKSKKLHQNLNFGKYQRFEIIF